MYNRKMIYLSLATDWMVTHVVYAVKVYAGRKSKLSHSIHVLLQTRKLKTRDQTISVCSTKLVHTTHFTLDFLSFPLSETGCANVYKE